MSLRAWITITQEQFDQYQCDWPEDLPLRNRKSYWVRMHFDGAWINKYATQQEALDEAAQSLEDGFEGQLVICGVDFDDETIIQALNYLQMGESMLDYYGICKEYTWVPHKQPA